MSQTTFTRREVLQIGGTALLTSTLAGSLRASAAPPKQILYFTKSAGFEHSVVKRSNGELGHSERILIEIGKKNGFEVTASKDGGIFDGEHERFDAYVFYTSGDLTKVGPDKAPAMSAKGKQALLDAVHGGKGFIGIHAATDSFRSASGERKDMDPYIAMVGGEFISHGEQQKAQMTNVDAKFPGMDKVGASFEMLEEWYALRNFAPDLHVLLVNETEGMKGPVYQRPPFPATWARKHGTGNVFYTSLGHREDVWENQIFEEILVGALRWVTGLAQAEVPPNMAAVTPSANTLAK